MHSLVDNLIRQAEIRPDASAVEFENESISYGELHRMSSALATTLLDRGIAPGGRVALWLRKSIESIVAIYGVLKAGAIYVPIDPSAPLNRVRLVITDCEVSYAVTHDDHVDWLAELLTSTAPGGCIVSVGNGRATDAPSSEATGTISWDEALHAPSVSPGTTSVGIDPHRPAYILYTSGSKGVPKGVALSHTNALAFVEWTVSEFGLGSADRFASHAPLHFDLSILDVFATCYAGGTLVLIPESQAGLGGALNRLITDRAVSVWYSVPNALTRMLAAKNSTLLADSALRMVLFAGEIFPIGRLRQLHAAVPSAELYNLYGPTETNVCTYHRVREVDLAVERTEPVPIGRPCPYATAFLIDTSGHCLEWKPGQSGELCVTGSSVMLGYWRDEDLAAAKTALITQDGSPPVAAYRTGDLVRLDDDLNLVFCGRADDMVKIRGHRVELGEVESVLSSARNIREVACAAVGEGDLEKRLEAYVVPVSHPCDISEVRRHCSSSLPRYMVPEQFHVIGSLPRTSTGKIDRRALLES